MAAIPREKRDYSVSHILDRRLDLGSLNIEMIAFIGLVLVSIVTHLWGLGHMAMHHDESVTSWTAWRFYTGAGGFTCAGGRASSTYCYDPVYHGPSYYVLTLISFILFGDGEAQARLPEALAGIALVASAWMLRPYFGARGSFIAGALMAFSPSLLYYTRFSRHDGLILLWTFWMVIGFFRWLDTGKPRYLYLLAAGAGLAMTTHELYYILFFIFGSFLLIRVLSELLPRKALTIAMLAILVVLIVIIAINPFLSFIKIYAGGPALLLAVTVGLGLLMMRIWGETPIFTARALMLWRYQRQTLWIALTILVSIFVLLFSNFFADPRGILDGLYQGISYWLSQHDYARGDQPWYYYLILMPLYEPIALLASIGAAIFLFSRKPFAQISDPAQASAPTDSYGQVNHIVDAPEAAQSDIEADEIGDAPEAEPLPIESLDEDDGAATTTPELPAEMAEAPGASAIAAAPPDAEETTHSFVAFVFPLFLAFWFFSAFLAFSWAGEKMPWLVTHIALPGNLLGAWALGRMLDLVAQRFRPSPAEQAVADEQPTSPGMFFLLPVVVVLMLLFIGIALWRIYGADASAESQRNLLQGLIPLLVAGALIYTILTIAQGIGARLSLALSGLALAAVFGIYEIHSTWMVVYDHPDTPRELLIFVQSSPDVPLISQDVHELSTSLTRNQRSSADPIGGHTMPVIMDTGDSENQDDYSLAWPYYWYFRDLQRTEGRDAKFFENATADSFQVPVDPKQPDGEKQLAPVVLVSVPHITDATRQALEANYVKRYSSHLNWWFPYGSKCSPQDPGYSRFYYSSWTSEATLKDESKGCGPNAPAIDTFAPPWGVLVWPFTPSNWPDLWRFLLYRDIPEQLHLSGREMEMWVRRDLAGGSSAQGATAVGGETLKLVSEQIVGSGQLEQPHGLAVDSNSNVYVSDSAKNRVLVFGPDGSLLRELGAGKGSAPGQFNDPHGLAIDKQGNLYVADTWNARIDKFDANGNFLKSWGQGQPDQDGRLVTMTDGTEAGNAAAPLGFYGPRGVAVDSQGNVYIADTGNKRIVVTDSEGTFKYQFGSSGAGLGQFNEPIGLALDGQGNLYVADSWNSRVQVFGPGQDGKLSAVPVVSWNVSGWQPSTYYDPFIAANANGQVYVSVPSRNMLLYANLRGDVLMRWGGNGTDNASLSLPSGVAVDSQGAIYVVDYGNMRVMKFRLPNLADPQGQQ